LTSAGFAASAGFATSEIFAIAAVAMISVLFSPKIETLLNFNIVPKQRAHFNA
jgi:hypothetical protein